MFYNLLCETIFQGFLHVFETFGSFTPGKEPHMFSHVPTIIDEL
jgi:hypothetical protein